MGLATRQGAPGNRCPRVRLPSSPCTPTTLYLGLAQLAGLAVLVGAWATDRDPLGRTPVVCLALCGLLVLFELRPIPIPRLEMTSDEITLSSTFGLAVLFVAPLGTVVATQTVALLIDAAARRVSWRKQPFNVAMFALSYGAAFLVLRALVPGDVHGQRVQPLVALVAGLAFFVCNNGMMAVLLGLRNGRGMVRQFLDDLRWQVIVAVPATALAPVVAYSALDSPWLLLFVLTPLLAVYRSGQIASRRAHEAQHDQLTGLGNRARIVAAMDRAFTAEADEEHAVLLIDLDHFKDVNDTLGHHVGDALLVTAAEVLTALTPEHGIVARLGGDEFAILLRRTDGDAARVVAAAIVDGLRQPRQIEGTALRSRGSVGISLFPRDGADRHELLRRADVALYRAKENRDGFVCYETGHDRAALEQLTTTNELAAVLEDPAATDEQLFLAYQPLFSGGDGSVCGVECLVRWDHPRLGLLLPGVFLPLAEHAGLSAALGRAVLGAALAQQRAWASAGLDLRISVNASVPELSDVDFPEVVAGLLAQHGVAPDRLVLEVTENSLIADPERSSEILRRIRATGTQVAIDDYGTGYASLAYLKQFAVDELKIDREFAAGVGADMTDRVIVESTIALAHQLSLRVVAEGIEDETTAVLLRAMGCDVLQGNALGTAGSAACVEALARRDPRPVGPPRLHVVGAA